MKKKLRVLSVLLALTMLLSLLTGCGGGKTDDPAPDSGAQSSASFDELMAMDWAAIEEAAKAEGEVTFTVWYNEAGFTELLKLFTDKYGIKVNMVISDEEAVVQKALAEKDGKVGTLDVAVVPNTVKTLLDAKIMYGPIMDKMESADLLDPGLSQYQEGVDHQGYVVPFYLNQTGFLYNSNKFSPADLPQNWDDLNAYIQANPKKFGICVPEKGGSGQAFTMLAIQEITGGLEQYYGDIDADESKTASWEKVWAWFNENEDKITLTTSNNDSISRLNQGELDLIVAWTDDTAVARAAGELGDQAVMYIPEMGTAGGGDTLGVFANAEHKAAALLLVNWLLSNEAQEAAASLLNVIPARTDIPAPDTGLTAEDMSHRTSWVPVAYKTKFIQDFTTYVLGQ